MKDKKGFYVYDVWLTLSPLGFCMICIVLDRPRVVAQLLVGSTPEMELWWPPLRKRVLFGYRRKNKRKEWLHKLPRQDLQQTPVNYRQ
jgi:hypothetical protein